MILEDSIMPGKVKTFYNLKNSSMACAVQLEGVHKKIYRPGGTELALKF